jgi:(R)-2-hydroxyacyl-CoA dehydratese activating ATPase
MAVTAGIDVGSLTAEAVLVDGDRILAQHRIGVLPNPVDSARAVLDAALADAGLSARDLARVVSTGYGREKVCAEGIAQVHVSEISCHGYGAHRVHPTVRTIVDIGGQDAKVIKVDASGELVDFVMNDKCAAGTGHFLEHMSRALGTTLDELGPLARRSRNPIHMSSRCTIFVETEVLHHLQRGVPKEDVAAAVTRALSERVAALVRRVGVERDLIMTGGVAKNVAVRAELERTLGVRMADGKIDPQLVGAYGAAMLARREIDR